MQLLAPARRSVEKEEMREWGTRHTRDKKKKKEDVGMEKEREKEEGEKLTGFFGAIYEFSILFLFLLLLPLLLPRQLFLLMLLYPLLYQPVSFLLLSFPRLLRPFPTIGYDSTLFCLSYSEVAPRSEEKRG